MFDPKMNLRKVWGALLLAAGLGMFFTIPEKAKEFQAQGWNIYAVKPVFYLVSAILTVGGAKKLFQKNAGSDSPDDKTEH